MRGKRRWDRESGSERGGLGEIGGERERARERERERVMEEEGTVTGG